MPPQRTLFHSLFEHQLVHGTAKGVHGDRVVPPFASP